MKKILTLCIIYQNSKLLLGMKKRGFGAGKWNGFGGKLHESESIEEGLRRESFEEARIRLQESEKVGIIDFEFEGDPKILEVHIFRCVNFEGEPVETEEMKPEWFPIDKIPYDLMWPDDKFWLPLLLEGKKFKGKFVFDKDTRILSHNLEIVEDL
jgi:8-oxo-dGTP diphosphatase / 2-hydroxy-dATP diphosphatase